MKKIAKKILICLLILFVLNNFVIGSLSENIGVAYAANSGTFLDGFNDLLSSVIGLISMIYRLPVMALALAADKLMGAVAYIESSNSNLGGLTSAAVTPFDVLFNTSSNGTRTSAIPLLEVNFFNINTSNTNSIMYKFRTSIALWYYVLRAIAAVILLVILLYVGIRMGLSTVSADQKAKYKKMLVDWVVSLALIFLMQYIMLFIIYVNDAIVNTIALVADQASMRYALDSIGKIALEPLNIDGIAATIIYCMLVFQTFALFISYFNRMLTIAFLTLISPLITLTYSIDRIGDGKAQALNTWLKEYVFTILIQPFHCIIYLAFISVAINLMTNVNAGATFVYRLGAGLIAIICINFMKKAEGLIRKIFAFGDNGKSGGLDTGMALAAVALKKSANAGKTLRKGTNAIRNIGSGMGNIDESFTNVVIRAKTAAAIMGGNNKDENGNRRDVDEIKEEIRTDVYQKKAEKEEKKKYGVSRAENDDKINKRVQSMMMADGSLSQKEAKAKARYDIAKETREAAKKKNKEDKFNKKHPTISKAVGFVRSGKQFAQSSETLKELGKLAKVSSAGGVATFLGAGTLGVTGHLEDSVLVGAAAYKGTQTFMASSEKTLRDDGTARLKSLGVKNSSEAGIQIQEIMADSSKWEGTDELKKIMDEIEAAITKSGITNPKAVATRISNTISNGIAKNPGTSVSTLAQNAIQAESLKSGIPTNNSALNSAVENLATFDQSKGIYDTIKQSEDIGISPDRLASQMVNSFGGSNISALIDNYKSDTQIMDDAKGITIQEFDKDNKWVAPDDDYMENILNTRNEEGVKELEKNIEREIREIDEKFNSSLDEEMIKQLTADRNQMEALYAKVQDAELDKNIKRLEKEANELVAKANRATEEAAKREVKKELERLQGEYDKFIGEAENFKTRVEMEGIKTKDDLLNQQNDMNSKIQNLETVKNRLGV